MISKRDLLEARWRKSSHSGASGGSCVEVCDDFPGVIPVRDSKVAHGPAVAVSEAAWASFVSAVKGDDFSA